MAYRGIESDTPVRFFVEPLTSLGRGGDPRIVRHSRGSGALPCQTGERASAAASTDLAATRFRMGDVARLTVAAPCADTDARSPSEEEGAAATHRADLAAALLRVKGVIARLTFGWAAGVRAAHLADAAAVASVAGGQVVPSAAGDADSPLAVIVDRARVADGT